MQSDRITRLCPVCGTAYQIRYATQVFCGVACKKKSQCRPIEERFWEKVNKTSSCWLWTGTRIRSGYGHISERLGPGRHRAFKAHRYSWILHNGPIPDGFLVCHRCDNPPCVRPDHLFLGTVQDNKDDEISKQRHVYGERVRTAKLDADRVREIRRAYTHGEATQVQLAEQFGVLQNVISKIVRRESWRHVA